MTTLNGVSIDQAGLVASLFRESFVETFGHLYAAEDLAAFLAEKTEAAFAREISDPSFAFVLASEGDDPIGFAKLGPPELPVETPPATIELRQIYVLERATGRGVGAQLMDWATQTAKVRQADHLQLSVYVDNHRARRFYARRGFVEIGPYHFMVGNHADEDIVMRLAL